MTAPSQAGRATTLLLVGAALLRLQGLGWDAWANLHPDERNLVAAAHGLWFPGGMVPGFHAYNGLALAAPKLVAFLACGPEPGYPCVTWAARLVSALLSGGAVWVAWRIALRLGGDAAGLMALLLVGLSAPLLQWSHFGTTESALTLAVLALWLQAMRFLSGEDGVWRTALASGAILGLGLGMKTTAGIFALLPLAALALGARRLDRRAVLAVPAGVALALALLAATTPALLLATADYLSVMRFEGDVVAGRADVFWTWQFAHARPVAFETAQLWRMMDGTALLLAAPGLVWALRRGGAGAWVVLPLVLAYLATILGWHARFTRYLAPVLPVLLVLAALGAAWLWRALPARTPRVALVVALALPALTGLSMAASYRSPDSRLLAAEDLAARLRPGDTVLLEPRDVGPSGFGEAEVRVLPLMDDGAGDKLDRIAADLEAGDWMLLYSRRHWAVLPVLPERFPEMCAYYAALAAGDLGYRVVARFARAAPLGRLVEPGLHSEETRVVFDRPVVYLLQNQGRLVAADLRDRIAAPPADCRPATIQAGFERPR